MCELCRHVANCVKLEWRIDFVQSSFSHHVTCVAALLDAGLTLGNELIEPAYHVTWLCEDSPCAHTAAVYQTANYPRGNGLQHVDAALTAACLQSTIRATSFCDESKQLHSNVTKSANLTNLRHGARTWFWVNIRAKVKVTELKSVRVPLYCL